LRTLAAILIVLIALLVAVAWLPVAQARNEWRAGNNAEAIAIADRWSALHLWPSDYEQVLAVSLLSAGNEAAARPHLARIGHPLIPAINKIDVARRLFARDRYADFLAYDAASQERNDSDEVRLYRAAAQTATNQIDVATRTLQSINAANIDRSKFNAVRAAIDQRKNDAVPYVFDRTNRAIADYRPQTNDVVSTDPDFAPLIDRDAGSLTIGAHLNDIGANDTIDTTLDPFVQQAALKALGKNRGSLVAIDPQTNEILAIANSGPKENRAFEKEYEPGSVVKVITGLNALTNGADVNSMFPYDCKGFLEIDGRHFGDWLPGGHGVLPSFDSALAVSCNVYFADLGLRVGRERLERYMTSAGFDGQINLGILQVPLGRTNYSEVFNNFETAFLAIGLKHEEMNAIHLAMLASMVANRGVLTTPRLVRDRRSIVGEILKERQQQGTTRIASASAANRMIQAMQAVATESRGTGRRAPVEGITMAMKTGTAGERQEGLDALILAFAPVDKPKIAFGVIAEGAGPAEFAGARIAHDFLQAMRPRL